MILHKYACINACKHIVCMYIQFIQSSVLGYLSPDDVIDRRDRQGSISGTSLRSGQYPIKCPF